MSVFFCVTLRVRSPVNVCKCTYRLSRTLTTANLTGPKEFGWDPIFQPDGFDKTFAEMAKEEKNKISHRFISGLLESSV